MKVLGIIPARAGSKRIPDKNIKHLGNKPLVQHILEAAIHSKLLTTIVVSSDSKEVLAIASKFKPIIAIERPQDLASDTSPAIDYVKHTLSILDTEYKNSDFDIVVILQATSPLTLPEDIDATIFKLIETKADSSVSMVELSHMVNPLKLKLLQGDKVTPYMEEEKGRMAAEEIPKVYVRNCAVYASTIETIMKGKIIGDDCRAYIMPPSRSIDINDPLDFDFAEFLYNKLPGKK